MKFRKATYNDLRDIIDMIANDTLGITRERFETPLPEEYVIAFENINSDKNQELVVVENEAGQIIGTFQLSFIQYLTYIGGLRAQLEAVRVRKEYRGNHIGRKMIEWAIERAKHRKAHILQLTTDKKRPQAIKFYQDLGFIPSHEGMKLHLD